MQVVDFHFLAVGVRCCTFQFVPVQANVSLTLEARSLRSLEQERLNDVHVFIISYRIPIGDSF